MKFERSGGPPGSPGRHTRQRAIRARGRCHADLVTAGLSGRGQHITRGRGGTVTGATLKGAPDIRWRL